MFTYEVKGIRVRYADTDQMGYVYYGNYARYYEIGRVEALRSVGFSYREMEEAGVMMPVYENRSRYMKPARYDDELTIKVVLKHMPRTRVVFEYEIRNQDDVLLNVGETTLVFQMRDTAKLCVAPEELLAKLNPYFQTS
ncbi:thioesterase family protein [Dyadobacter sp. LHD-138]|uniref:acyl-CoA thioesterase n=1 Tax=Dyadobacter sp. LHD-138 TaxID=3071413 RepID=UPI0027E07E7E|nr:thioesterase family protein [Dyadobacter sp. LHD-138]MDQ6482207.1 thioesterase family protein [Dyadobacter sp. LHD-138]